MRLWTLHPSYLDSPGLTAAWREGLLAKAVLNGRTVGYQHHPQLARFRAARDPHAAIETYLAGLCLESERRGFHFDKRKLAHHREHVRLRATRGQLMHEWRHLLNKLRQRSPEQYAAWVKIRLPDAHPMFRIVAGPVADWEKSWQVRAN
jgi:hypothetical protein